MTASVGAGTAVILFGTTERIAIITATLVVFGITTIELSAAFFFPCNTIFTDTYTTTIVSTTGGTAWSVTTTTC